MTKREFMRSTPNDVYLFLEQNQKRIEAEQKQRAELIDHQAWLTGAYVQRAVASVMSKRAKYPKEPFTQKKPSKMVAHEHMTAEEKQTMIDQLFSNLDEMKGKFEASHVST